MRLVLSWIALTVVVAVTVALVPGIHVEWTLGLYWAIAGVLAVANVAFGLILRLLGVPLLVLSWGLPALALNVLLLQLADGSLDSVQVTSFWAALVGAAPIAVVAFVVEAIVRSMESTLSRPT